MLAARSSPRRGAPVPSAGARTRPARTQPRLPGPAHLPRCLRARRCGQLHRAAAARARADGLRAMDGRGRCALDPARPLLRDDRGRAGRSERPQADDVPGRPRAGDAYRPDPDLGRAGWPDAGGDPPRDGADEHPPVILPGRLHGVGADPRRTAAARPGQLDLRGGLLVRLHHRARDRRASRGDDRRRAHARDRCRLVRDLELRAGADPARPSRARRALPSKPRRGHPGRHRLHHAITRSCGR